MRPPQTPPPPTTVPAPAPRPATKRRRRALALAALILLAAGVPYASVQRCRRWICPDAASAPVRPVAVVFGAAGDVLSDRVTTAAELYHAGKVQKLLMTGDNGRNSYNEPAEMRREALALGVPARDIVCDYAGFRTYDSLYRARDVFGVRSALLVTQSYHLPRALFLGRALGLDVVGVDAARHEYAGQAGFDLREIAAVEVAWWQAVVTRPKPKFLGKPEPLFGGEEREGPHPDPRLKQGERVKVEKRGISDKAVGDRQGKP